MNSNQKKEEYDRIQKKIREALELEFLVNKKLDNYSAMRSVVKDIFHKKKSRTKMRFIGWDNPEKAPYSLPDYRATTSHTKYNLPLIVAGEEKIEYDFNQAYTKIMMEYPLPSNTMLPSVIYTTEKAISDRIFSYDRTRPFENLSTFNLFGVSLEGRAKKGTYAVPNSHGMLARYGEVLKLDNELITEIELKILIDYYEIDKIAILYNHTFKCKKNMLEDYFSRIEPLSKDPETLTLYKSLRTKIYGYIGQNSMKKGDEEIFNQPIFNRAYAAMVAGVFREKMIHYEQKYIQSEYGLITIVVDGIYFKKEVPEFEKLVSLGVVKKKRHIITEEEENQAKSLLGEKERITERNQLRFGKGLL